MKNEAPLPLPGILDDQEPSSGTQRKTTGKRANELSGREWTRNSISVWSDIRKSREEEKLGHPALFPVMLVERLIRSYTTAADTRILDPFAGVGSTLVAAKNLGRHGIGVELNDEFANVARQRLNVMQPSLFEPTEGGSGTVIVGDALELKHHLASNSVDMVVTSPPYWDVLERQRSADYKAVRNYGDRNDDLGKIADYDQFLELLRNVFVQVFDVLRDGKYCIVIVMDLRKKNQFFPYHMDLAYKLRDIGFILDDIFIWNRSAEYNNLRPLGYPAVFRVNKIHEYCLVFQKPL